jgi:hypothetical protein
MKLTIDEIAEICHENNRSYSHSLGDYSSPAWKFLPDELKATTKSGVLFHVQHPDVSPRVSHENWLADKKAAGWVYGEVKDFNKKTHPCMVPYEQLPKEERTKDLLFSSMVQVLKEI